MTSYKDIAQKIRRTYENSLFSLPVRNQHHFALRSYRVYGAEKYLRPIFTDFSLRTQIYYPKMIKYAQGESPRRLGIETIAKFRSEAKKKIRRRKVYQKHPQFPFYTGLVRYLFFAKSYNLNRLPLVKSLYESSIERIKQEKIEEILYADELVRVNPTAISNTAYYLDFLGVEASERKLLKTIKNFWLNKEPVEKIDRENKLYGLTHLFISASYYYQRFLERGKFSWILSYFEENIEDIIENSNLDLIGEVGLSFKLCKEEDSSSYKKAKEYIASKFDEKLGYIPREENNTLQKAQHRNTVALLLLENYKDLNKGPDLYRYMEENSLSLFLPEKGEFVYAE
jgi:hypothetical protein